MNVLILYFSGTGNTEYIARYLQKHFNKEKHNVALVPIEKFDKDNVGRYDVLGFGFPVFACDVPTFVKDYLVGLPSVTTKSVFVFCTQGFFSGSAIEDTFDLFRQLGYSPISYADIVMPGSDGLAFTKPDSKRVQNYMKKDYSKIPEVDQMITDVENKMEQFDHTLKIQELNLPVRRWKLIQSKTLKVVFRVAEGWLKKKFWADESCVKCKKCEQICPMNNIQVDDQGVHFSDKCVVCMRCLHQCPVESIQIGKGTIGKVRWKGPLGDYNPPKSS